MNNYAEYVTRPQWSDAIRGKRAEVWLRRYQSAYDLAAIVCGDNVTQSEYEAASALLNSVQRYALADAREWEAENSSERYCNSKCHKDKQKQLDARRARLQKRLDRYGLRLVNYGLYPTIIDAQDRDMYMLHYFD